MPQAAARRLSPSHGCSPSHTAGDAPAPTHTQAPLSPVIRRLFYTVPFATARPNKLPHEVLQGSPGKGDPQYPQGELSSPRAHLTWARKQLVFPPSKRADKYYVTFPWTCPKAPIKPPSQILLCELNYTCSFGFQSDFFKDRGIFCDCWRYAWASTSFHAANAALLSSPYILHLRG